MSLVTRFATCSIRVSGAQGSDSNSDPQEGPVKVYRVYTGDDGLSRFEALEIPFEPAYFGTQWQFEPGSGPVIFRQLPAGETLDFHNPPRRQMVVTISGAAEIECGDGSRLRIGPGDTLFVEDLTGRGHLTREIDGPRRSINIPLPDDLDVTRWRASGEPATP
jgi:hypothetical protein